MNFLIHRIVHRRKTDDFVRHRNDEGPLTGEKMRETELFNKEIQEKAK